MRIRTGTVQEAVELTKRLPDFSNPYNLNSPETPPPQLDHILIAEIDGVAVGFRAGARHSHDTFAVWLAGVLPKYRRQGIATALYRRQKDWLKSHGFRFIRTHVRNSNRVMLKILIDNGYQVVDVVRYDDISRNKIVFVKDLQETSSTTAGPLVLGLLRFADRIADRRLENRFRDFTISWLRFKYLGRIIEDSSVNAILDRAAESRHKYCLVLPHGTIVSHAWELGMVKTIENWASERQFFVAGRILREQGTACGIAPEGLLVDLEVYKTLPNPNYGLVRDAEVEVALPTPESLAPAASGRDLQLCPSGTRGLVRPWLPGWSFVSASLEAGLIIPSLPEKIIGTLLRIAPDSDRQLANWNDILGDAIATKALNPADFNAAQLKFLTGVQRQVQNSRRGIFVWNFESYDDVNEPPGDFKAPISTLYSVAAGLKTSWILQTHGFDEQTKLVYFDYSEQALKFKKLLHEEWDGEDYPSFLRYLFGKMQPGEAFYQLWGGFSPEEMEWNVVREAWNRETLRWGSEQVIREHWLRAKRLKVEYVLCNVLENPGTLTARIENRPSSVIWWSNVFFTFYSNWFHTIEERRNIYETFVRDVTARNPEILIYGNDYNNIPVQAIAAGEYSSVYFQTPDDYLEPRRIRG